MLFSESQALTMLSSGDGNLPVCLTYGLSGPSGREGAICGVFAVDNQGRFSHVLLAMWLTGDVLEADRDGRLSRFQSRPGRCSCLFPILHVVVGSEMASPKEHEAYIVRGPGLNFRPFAVLRVQERMTKAQAPGRRASDSWQSYLQPDFFNLTYACQLGTHACLAWQA